MNLWLIGGAVSRDRQGRKHYRCASHSPSGVPVDVDLVLHHCERCAWTALRAQLPPGAQDVDAQVAAPRKKALKAAQRKRRKARLRAAGRQLDRGDCAAQQRRRRARINCG